MKDALKQHKSAPRKVNPKIGKNYEVTQATFKTIIKKVEVNPLEYTMTERVMNMLKTKFGEDRLICWNCGDKIKVGDEVISSWAVRGKCSCGIGRKACRCQRIAWPIKAWRSSGGCPSTIGSFRS